MDDGLYIRDEPGGENSYRSSFSLTGDPVYSQELGFLCIGFNKASRMVWLEAPGF
jgi:hypothetical protein